MWSANIFNVNNEYWYNDFENDSREVVIEEAKKIAIKNNIKSFKIGRKVSDDIPYLSGEDIIEYAIDKLSDEIGEELASSYLDAVTDAQEKELERMLNDVFFRWHRKNNLLPSSYTIEDEEDIIIK